MSLAPSTSPTIRNNALFNEAFKDKVLNRQRVTHLFCISDSKQRKVVVGGNESRALLSTKFYLQFESQAPRARVTRTSVLVVIVVSSAWTVLVVSQKYS